MEKEKPFIIGHRGIMAYEPENTLRSVKKALTYADLVEIDVHMSKDGHVVVIHDSEVDRTTNGTGKVKDMTLKELKKLDAGRGERIPTLQEVIDLIKGKKKLIIEIKSSGAEEKVIQIIENNNLKDDVIIVSFYHPVVKKIKELSDIKTGVIFSSQPVNAVKLALDANADIMLPNWKYITPEMVEDAHKHGLLIFSWTIDEPNDIKRMVEMGVDGIATNKADVAKEVLSEEFEQST